MVFMLRECNTHGYYRGDACPECGDEGRFLMNEHELNRVGRIMAGVLRHFPDKFGVDIDDHGWVEIDDFVGQLRRQKERLHWIRAHHVVAIAATDAKGRYQVDGGRFRATYAHSIDVDLSDLPSDDIPKQLYYPVTEEELDVVLERGLHPTDRLKVHLSESAEQALSAGQQRTEDPIILAIDAAGAQDSGVAIHRAGKTVYVTDGVPSDFLRQAEQPAE